MKFPDILKRNEAFLLPACLFVMTVISRIPFTSKYLYHMDSVQFALALDKFDVTIHQPHPPGYFLYVMLGRILHLFIHDANMVFVTISIFFSGMAVVAVYLLGKEMFDRKTAVVAAFLAASSADFWFHGEVAQTYAVEAFFSCFIAFLCWRIRNGKTMLIYLSVAVLAIAGGIRQNTPVFLAPLWLFSVRSIVFRRIFAALALFILLSLCWFVPMLYMTGGPVRYFMALKELWSIAGTHNSVFVNGLDALMQYSDTVFSYVAYCIGGGLVVLIFGFYYILRNRKIETLKKGKTLFLLVWVLPILAFHLLETPGIPGHMLIILPPLVLLVAGGITYINGEVYSLTGRNISIAAVSVLVAVNLYIFFLMKYPVSYPVIRAHDKNLPEILDIIKSYNLSTTVLLLDYNYRFYSFDHVGYYLPSYTILEPAKASDNAVGKGKTFARIDGHTIIIDKIVLPDRISAFVTIIRSVDFSPRCCDDTNIKVLEPIPEYYLVSGPIFLVNNIYPGFRNSE